MKYILMMNAPRNAYEHLGASWSKEAFQAHIRFMKDFNKGLQASGNWVQAEGLADPRQAVHVHASNDGLPVTDGVFPESKEFLAGFWIVKVDSPEQAHALAAKVSTAPGPSGGPLNMTIEVREVLSAPPDV